MPYKIAIAGTGYVCLSINGTKEINDK